MDIEELLGQQEHAVVDETVERISDVEPHRRDRAAARRLVEGLYREVAAAVGRRDVTELRAHVRRLARERRDAGFALADLEAVLAALEDALWDGALARLPVYDQAWGHGLVATALAHGRDALRRAFDPSAPRACAPYPDLSPLFRGSTESRLAPCPAEELDAAA